MRHLSLLAQNIGISIPLTELFVDSYTSLSLVPTSMTSTGSSYSTEDAVLRTTRTSLVSLCKIVNTTYRIELHALILLQR